MRQRGPAAMDRKRPMNTDGVQEIAASALAHVRWLEQAGVSEVPRERSVASAPVPAPLPASVKRELAPVGRPGDRAPAGGPVAAPAGAAAGRAGIIPGHQVRRRPCERDACAPFLARELALLRDLRVVVCLGAFGYEAACRHLGVARRPRFGHGVEAELETGLTLLCSFHPSQQNTFTGRLTEEMLDAVFARAVELAR